MMTKTVPMLTTTRLLALALSLSGCSLATHFGDFQAADADASQNDATASDGSSDGSLSDGARDAMVSDGSSDATISDGASDASLSCTDVCAHYNNLCRPDVDDCMQGCATAPETVRQCVANATTCALVQLCVPNMNDGGVSDGGPPVCPQGQVRLTLELDATNKDGSALGNRLGSNPVITTASGQFRCGGLLGGQPANACTACVPNGSQHTFEMKVPWLRVTAWNAPTCRQHSNACEVTANGDSTIRVNLVKTAAVIFATSTQFQGNLGSPEDTRSIANIECARASGRANLPDEVVPLLGNGQGLPQSLVNLGPWVRLNDGAVVAQDFGELSRGVQRPILFDENGAALASEDVAWSGRSSSGAGTNCGGWSTNGGTNQALVAHPSRFGMRGVSGALAWHDFRNCNEAARLICAEQPGQRYDNLVIPPPPVSNPLYMFRHHGGFGFNNFMTPDNMDATCQADAVAGTLPTGSYRAFVTTSAGSAMSRFGTIDRNRPIVQPTTNAILWQRLGDLEVGRPPLAAPAGMVRGSTIPWVIAIEPTALFTGIGPMGVAALAQHEGDHCSNFSNYTLSAYIGEADAVDFAEMTYGLNISGTTTPNHHSCNIGTQVQAAWLCVGPLN